MSKTLNLVNTAANEYADLLVAADTLINRTNNRRASNNASTNKISITNYHASNTAKVSLYIEQLEVSVLAALYAASGDSTITHTSNTSIVAGMEVAGTGIPASAIVDSVTSATVFELSANTTILSGGTGNTLTLVGKHYIISNVDIPPGATLVLDDKITFNVTTHKLVIHKNLANTRITVIID